MSDKEYPKPPVLKFATIREIVEEFRSKYIEDIDKIPVALEDLIERKLGIEIRPEINLLDESKVEAFLSNDLKTIFVDLTRYNLDVYEKRTRFTLAHELGHYVLHKNIYESIDFSDINEWIEFVANVNEEDLDWFEMQANEFAGRLLVPKNNLIKEIRNLRDQIKDLVTRLYTGDDGNNYDEGSVEAYISEGLGRKLSDKFMVSPKVIEIRLKREKIFEELDISLDRPS